MSKSEYLGKFLADIGITDEKLRQLEVEAAGAMFDSGSPGSIIDSLRTAAADRPAEEALALGFLSGTINGVLLHTNNPALGLGMVLAAMDLVRKRPEKGGD